jgi:tRNA(fMet)-specific endonuclease VapC
MATYVLSGRSPEARKRLVIEREHAIVAVSAITQGEILFGLENNPKANRLRTAIEEFFSTIEVLAWNSQTAHAYGRLRARISAAGKVLSAMDLLIASHAIAVNAILVTHNVRADQ